METTAVSPLSGLRVLVTRPAEEASILKAELLALGAIPIELPTIEIAPPESYTQLDNAIRELDSYDWIIFTSVHGVQFFLSRLQALGCKTSILQPVKIAAVGPSTAATLQTVGRKPDFIPEDYLTEKIASGLGDVREKRILLPRTDIASKKLPELLRTLGARVDEVTAYRTITPANLSNEKLTAILAEGIDLIVFTSPSTARNLARTLVAGDFAKLKKCKVACIGPVTAEAARELGFQVEIVAKNHTINSLVEEIVNENRNL